jgi:hypothetical protein
VSEGAICLFDGRKVLLPDATPKGLVGHYTFDDVKILDSSGNGNHGKFAIPSGPGANAYGSSAMFNGFDWVEIPHTPSFAGSTFSISMWIYIYKDPATTVKHGGRWCPLLHKGASADDGAPSLSIHTEKRQAKMSVATTSDQHPLGEFKESNAKLPVNRWAHVAMVRTATENVLYINGIRDSKVRTEGAAVGNKGSLFIGGVPWLADSCHISSYVDEVRVYSRPLLEDEIQAEASPALGGIEPAMVQLGCKECDVTTASRSCIAGYHLCTAMELHTGGYQVARLQGYADWHTHVWSHGQYAKTTAAAGTSAHAAEMAFSTAGNGAAPPAKGLGLCCNDNR